MKRLSQDILNSSELNHKMVLACKYRDEQLYYYRELEKCKIKFEENENFSREDFLQLVDSIPKKRSEAEKEEPTGQTVRKDIERHWTDTKRHSHDMNRDETRLQRHSEGDRWGFS